MIRSDLIRFLSGLCLLLPGLILSPGLVHAQSFTLQGQLKDGATGEGVAHASVYINGSTLGTSSDEEGFFSIEECNLPFELVVSHVAYEIHMTPVYTPPDPSAPMQLRLNPKLVSLPEVRIHSKDSRSTLMTLFNKYFLGTSYRELHARILNDTVLRFYNLEGNCFEARATAPLKVELPKTGYLLTVDLVSFTLGYTPDSTALKSYIIGYFHFTSNLPRSRIKFKRIIRKRNQVYYNSRTHFLKALYNNKLTEEGYRLIARCPPNDTVPDFVMHYTSDSQGNALLCLSDFNCRQYHLPFYEDAWNRPSNLVETRFTYDEIIWNYLLFQTDTVRIYPSGQIYEEALLIGGSMGEKGVAHSLPGDFIPELR